MDEEDKWVDINPYWGDNESIGYDYHSSKDPIGDTDDSHEDYLMKS